MTRPAWCSSPDAKDLIAIIAANPPRKHYPGPVGGWAVAPEYELTREVRALRRLYQNEEDILDRMRAENPDDDSIYAAWCHHIRHLSVVKVIDAAIEAAQTRKAA